MSVCNSANATQKATTNFHIPYLQKVLNKIGPEISCHLKYYRQFYVLFFNLISQLHYAKNLRKQKIQSQCQ